MSSGGKGGYGLFGMSGVCAFSWVNTDWNCVLSIWALCSGVVVNVSLLSLSDVMVVVS